MAKSEQAVEFEHVACETCLREVPLSEAKVFEAEDYVAYFCGLECFETWKNIGAVRVKGEQDLK